MQLYIKFHKIGCGTIFLNRELGKVRIHLEGEDPDKVMDLR